MKVISIIVTYNRKELLKECIESLKNQKDAHTDILVIDNNSDDGTKEMIANDYNDIYYENTYANLGGAGGFNYGLKKAFLLEKEYDYFWLMDDDTIPNLDSLRKILDVAEKNKNFGFISAKTVWTDNKLCKMNKQIKKNKKEKIDENTENMEKLETATFVACFINRQAILYVGLPIKEFFIWGDDTEYTKRISNKYDCFYINTCKIVHKMKNNLDANIIYDKPERLSRYYYQYRNRFYTSKKYGIKKIIRYHASILKTIIMILVKSKNYKFKRIKIIFKGYCDGIKFNPKIEYIKDKN